MVRANTRSVIAVALALCGSITSSAYGQLEARYRGAEINDTITFVMRGAPGDFYINILSVTEGPTCFPPAHPVGCIDLDLGLLSLSFVAPGFFGTMPGGGEVQSTFSMPNLPFLDGFNLKHQLIKIVSNKLTAKSNLDRILFTLGDQWHDSVGTIGNDRLQVAAVTLDDGRILLAGGAGANLELCEIYDPWLQEFSPAASLNQGREGGTATRLGDGKVLVTGGSDINLVVTSSAEVYDPALDTWTPVGSMATARVGQSANLLANGKVLVAGGSTDLSSVLNAALSAQSSSELYDPTAGTFGAGPSLARPHTVHSAVELANGDILFAGGGSFHKVVGIPVPDISDKAQVYSAAGGTFGGELTMKAGRVGCAAARLADGRVLLAGGIGGTIVSLSLLSSAELFDPGAVSFATTGSMSLARAAMPALLLPSSHQILVAGGGTSTNITNPTPTDVCERFDPTSGTFIAATSLASPRAGAGGVLLENELAAIFGGAGVAAPAALYRD